MIPPEDDRDRIIKLAHYIRDIPDIRFDSLELTKCNNTIQAHKEDLLKWLRVYEKANLGRKDKNLRRCMRKNEKL
jgi:hypothetical protein